MESGDLEAFCVLYAAGAAEDVDADFRKTLGVEHPRHGPLYGKRKELL